MTKKDLVAAIAEKAGLSKKDSEAALNAFIATVEETLKAGEAVQLTGFGTFEVRERAERQALNPRTKEPITVAATKVPAFKAGKGLKDIIA
ncbi:MAG: HU family DNA-binding protein [Ruminococcaceae bacterium]|nr:HU family DNA-binding protein [Oscillospiraceae bacterium]